MPDTDINPLAPVKTVIDPEKRRDRKQEQQHEKDEEEEPRHDEAVIVDIHPGKREESHVVPVNNRKKSEVVHEDGKGDNVDFTV